MYALGEEQRHQE